MSTALIIIKTWLLVMLTMNFVMLLSIICGDARFNFFSPRTVYDNSRLNWFGAWTFSILFHLTFPIIVFLYWIWKVFTVGRGK